MSESNFEQSEAIRSDNSAAEIALAAAHIAVTISTASEDQRPALVDVLKSELAGVGVVLTDMHQTSADERHGALTGRTRQQVESDVLRPRSLNRFSLPWRKNGFIR